MVLLVLKDRNELDIEHFCIMDQHGYQTTEKNCT